ncbi:glycosyltransferase family A protein [Paenibacillus thiaminolyticus]|uniref:glycosyltransferase family A protein n=1 Tax=Paenibacillus thiaminolyticus TaxID=49283 RepID=UPI0035A66B7F
MKKVGIVFTTYNNGFSVEVCLDSCMKQNYPCLEIIIADDGSTDDTVATIRSKALASPYPVTLLELPHGERGVARVKAVEAAQQAGVEYLLVIDSDMILDDHLVRRGIEYFTAHPQVGALVVPEEAFTHADNFFSKVKVFERNVINNAGEELGKRSIEAARFWRMEAFLHVGGFNAEQISFEEIQPTLRYIEMGGIVRRATFSRIYHDEKKVLLRELLSKKAYYFSVMDRTLTSEREGFRKALERWYFFRPVLYSRANLLKYIKHPILTVAMLYMYVCLSLIGAAALLKSRLFSK